MRRSSRAISAIRSGLDRGRAAAGAHARPTAIFASNDDMAAATVSVAHRRGLDVPGDLSIVGFDDTALATSVWPELTTVKQPIAAMAEAALELLHCRPCGAGAAALPASSPSACSAMRSIIRENPRRRRRAREGPRA